MFIWLFVSFYMGFIWLSSDCQSGCAQPSSGVGPGVGGTVSVVLSVQEVAGSLQHQRQA